MCIHSYSRICTYLMWQHDIGGVNKDFYTRSLLNLISPIKLSSNYKLRSKRVNERSVHLYIYT